MSKTLKTPAKIAVQSVSAKEKEKAPVSRETTRYQALVPHIEKRDGRLAPFDFDKIAVAIGKAMAASDEGNADDAVLVAHQVAGELARFAKKYKNFLPTVEGIQDSVEKHLILNDYVKTAKAYILYRDKRSQMRAEQVEVPEHVRKLSEESAQYFKNNPLGEFVYLRTYAKWIPAESRRETWIETVDRYLSFMRENIGDKLTEKEYAELRTAILQQDIMPSMRLMQFAGDAARRDNICAYNCSYIAPSQLEDFAEIMYISMRGTGVGYSVESQNIQALPQIKYQTGKKLEMFVVADSAEGWAQALTAGLTAWFNGNDVEFDFSLVRPAGTRLKTMGGKASGPEPLRSLLSFTRDRVLMRQGRRLRNIDAHDIICKIGECVVAGGVRRSAMISLSDLDDTDVRDAKKGQFFMTDPHRSVANNSAVYTMKPTNAEFMDEWVSLMKGGTGERGIFNRGGLIKQLPKRRIEYWREVGYVTGEQVVGSAGTNPCGEIILKSKQFCNLSEVVARPSDTKESLVRKARLATILGTYQSTLVNLRFLSPEWKKNCEEERLLGVSITGQWDAKAVRNAEILRAMRAETIKVNKKYATRFGIQASTAITCVKPSGTVSQTIGVASGMHARHAPYYIRRIRISATDSLFKMLRDQGMPYHPEVGQSLEEANTYVLEFPVKSPEGAICKDDLSALDQLEHWKLVKEHFTEHNPSVTISVGDDEWISVANWLYANWDMIGGLSFLPRSNHVYRLAPYEAITKEQYDALVARLPKLDYSKLYSYERQDETELKRELACAGGTCEIV